MSTGFLVWHLNLRWRAELDRALAPLGLTSAQYAALASLYALSAGGTDPSQRAVADFSGLEPMYVSKLVRVLERNELVERARDQSDTRTIRVRITERGKDVLGAARSIVRRLDRQRLAALGGDRSKQTEDLRAMLLTLLQHAGDDATDD